MARFAPKWGLPNLSDQRSLSPVYNLDLSPISTRFSTYCLSVNIRHNILTADGDSRSLEGQEMTRQRTFQKTCGCPRRKPDFCVSLLCVILGFGVFSRAFAFRADGASFESGLKVTSVAWPADGFARAHDPRFGGD